MTRRPGRGSVARASAVVGAGLCVLAGTTGQAFAGELISSKASAPRAVERSCIKRQLAGADGVATRSVKAPAAGFLSARLTASSGDWDLAVFDAASHERVAGSTAFGASEVAEGFVASGERLTVQACRRSGNSSMAKLSVAVKALPGAKPETISLVRVSTPNKARKDELTNLGLDLTEHGGPGFVEVVLHGADDARALRRAKFVYSAEIADLVRQGAKDRAADRRFRASSSASALPSGRSAGYRRLDDFTQEMKDLVAKNPEIVKPITLPFKTLSGRSVQGIEITENVKARDGKPIFLQLGVHHAREWPSGEHAMEWAYDLVNGYKANDSRVRRLMSQTRTIVVPVVNPDGFNTSREAASAMDDGRGGPDDTPNFATFPYEYQRKNCRVNSTDPAVPDPERADCAQVPAQGLSQFGVDPNRNYGGFWGGPGASYSGQMAPGGDFAQDYRGDAPFSERETQNVRSLVSHRQVVTMITNHTFSGLVLRPPGIQVEGPSVDEPVYKALGDSMAAQNGYVSQPSYQLYDTTGGTEDWTYYATGGLGYTFEIGPKNFHPAYADTVAEYEGTADLAKKVNGKGNREAYFQALESTANAGRHSVVTGKAPPGAVLRLRKSFKTSTSPVIGPDGVAGSPILFDDTLDTTMEVPASGRFRWGINPSTRPVVAQDRGRPKTGEPSPAITIPSTPPAAPCGAAAADNPACYKDFGFTVPSGGGADNAQATVEINWATPASDYDITVFRDTNGDGSSTGEQAADAVGTSAQGTTNKESTTFGEPAEVIAGKKYVVRVVNFAGAEAYSGKVSFQGPATFVPKRTESWTLTCETAGGKVAGSRQLTIARGQSKVENFGAQCARAVSAANCITTRGGVRALTVGRARLGRGRKSQRRVLGGRRLKARRGIDRYCVRGGAKTRIGYPTGRLVSRVSAKTRKRIRRRAILAISSSRRYRLRRSRVGTSTRVLRKRLRGERRYRVGKSTWYVVRGKKSALIYRTQGRKVRELGIANRRLTSTKRGTKRFLRSWDRRGL